MNAVWILCNKLWNLVEVMKSLRSFFNFLITKNPALDIYSPVEIEWPVATLRSNCVRC